MFPVVHFISNKCTWYVLPYLDYFLPAPLPPGRTATSSDCSIAFSHLSRLFLLLGFTLQLTKGFWEGTLTM